MQQFQWYPGHMTKARRAMQEDIKLVDMVIELVDARVPQASRNPDINTLSQGKSRVIVLNKADLADDRQNKAWAAYYQNQGYHVVMLDARMRSSVKKVQEIIAQAGKAKMERDRRRGILNRPVRAMVAGIPNVGKSTFINTIAGKAAAKTGNKPGVTRGNQWIKLNKSVELLDTPGILWPKFEDQTVGLRLALIGSIRDDIMNITELACQLILFMQEAYPGVLEARYELESAACSNLGEAACILEKIAEFRHCLAKGGAFDMDKAAALLMDDFRSGRLGKITLEIPESEQA
ncbi:MAG: ribosome biogenesis GTPase YlqF [Lachnospiraceae bacterium]|nr:ribosome biogenesis GTPase YlqF [Lachnospiraceae bacterium]